MIFNLTGGGGGAALNFKIVGNPQPTNPKENTIWVDTDVKITGWVFSATEPGTPEPGMVWIFTGTSSPVEYNALKKNGIQVYPVSAKQYANGVWVGKTAKIYQNGAWALWTTYLYKQGDEYANLTGGFSKTAGNSAGTQTLTKLSDCLRLVSIGSSNSGSNFTVSTAKKINLTAYTTLCARIRHTDNGNTTFYIGTHDTNNIMPYDASRKLAVAGSTVDTVSLDISTVSGNYYVLIGMSGRATQNSGECDVYEVYLK